MKSVEEGKVRCKKTWEGGIWNFREPKDRNWASDCRRGVMRELKRFEATKKHKGKGGRGGKEKKAASTFSARGSSIWDARGSL